jgi:hypothetical protein
MGRQERSRRYGAGYGIGVVIGHILLVPFKLLAWAIRKAGR